jgi:hypothetical protein
VASYPLELGLILTLVPVLNAVGTNAPGSSERRVVWASIILVFWCIWRHRNDVVFNGAVASQMTIKRKIKDEFVRWQLAKLFCSDVFGFPQPNLFVWQLGE